MGDLVRKRLGDDYGDLTWNELEAEFEEALAVGLVPLAEFSATVDALARANNALADCMSRRRTSWLTPDERAAYRKRSVTEG